MSAASEIISPIRSLRISAVSPRRVQSSGVIPIALRVRNFRRIATRMRVSIGVAVLVVMAAFVLFFVSTVSSGVLSSSTALIMGFCLLHVIVGAAIHLLVHRNARSRKAPPDH